jgi:hypothetical protein
MRRDEGGGMNDECGMMNAEFGLSTNELSFMHNSAFIITQRSGGDFPRSSFIPHPSALIP